MGAVDFNAKTQVNYKKETCYKIACDACRKLEGFTIDREDKVTTTIYLKGKMSLFSWGEFVTVSISSLDNGLSELFVNSSPKIGGAFGPGLYGDMGKNKKNIIYIQQAIAEELKKYPEDAIIKSSSENTSFSVADEITKLKKLLDDGVLTQEEFNTKKKQLLNI